MINKITLSVGELPGKLPVVILRKADPTETLPELRLENIEFKVIHKRWIRSKKELGKKKVKNNFKCSR